MTRAYGRLVEHDPASRAYGVAVPDGITARSVEWRRWSPILDQGQLGSCTGNAMAGLLGTEPFSTNATDAARYDETYALRLYSLATQLDRFPGTYPPDDTGSSGLAVAKAAKKLGEIRSYSWAFSTLGLLHALQVQPVIVGTVWLSDMENPDADGIVRVKGQEVGGHEYLVRGYDSHEQLLLCSNSWGTGWGDKGEFRIHLSDWNVLRSWQADVTVPHV